MNINDKFKQSRKERGLSYYKMADLTGLAPSTLCGLEKGRIKDPKISLLSKLCRGLEIDINDLIKDTEFDYKQEKTNEM